MINYIIEKVAPYLSKIYFKKYFDWFIRKLDLQDKVEILDKKKNKAKHTIQPRKGDIYLIEFGQNVGKELSNTHMGIIIQSSNNNVASHTVVVVPISSSKYLYSTQEKILEKDIKEGKLDKIPSKAKVEQIICIDKARMIYKIGSVTEEFLSRLEVRIVKNLGIKSINKNNEENT